ncbi:MAG TPA: VWA domain-containing protein [Pyrinomonadaceae bacterium]|nr:VWA domain-containing protein [Pyrinomonadaceae bacterium]
MRRRLTDCVLGSFLLACLGVCLPATLAQTKPQKPAEPQDDVIRVNTELVQTDVMVFDKDGHFVDGLKADQFELKVNGKPAPVSLFERVTSGRLAQPPAAASNSADAANPAEPTAPSQPRSTIVQGRAIIFFIDDLHLSPASVTRTRQALLDFIDRGMADNDQVAITSASGQIGFLQQFTTDRFALRSAVARLNYRSGPGKTDSFRPPMSEYIALKIREGDQNVIDMYVSEMMKEECIRPAPGEPLTCQMAPQAMKHLVEERAQMITTQSAPDTVNTLELLAGLMRTAAQLPGRKLVFMISDGFYLSERTMASREKIHKVTEAAGRAGVVIYTLDARGLMGEFRDAQNDRPMDSGGFTIGLTGDHIPASQDGLNALAGDTGGRAFRNTNGPMAEWVGKMLDETANYYLLAWRPETDEQKRGKFNHIEASIPSRPELTVRLRSSYFKSAPLPVLSVKKKTEKDPEKARADDMRLVIDAPIAQADIPTKLDVRVAQMPGIGTQAAAVIEIRREALSFDLKDGKQAADLDIGGIFYNDKGKPIDSFVGRLRVFPIPDDVPPDKRKGAIYGFRVWLPPGLYQVRVAVRDLSSGRLGSATQFIDIPRLGK